MNYELEKDAVDLETLIQSISLSSRRLEESEDPHEELRNFILPDEPIGSEILELLEKFRFMEKIEFMCVHSMWIYRRSRAMWIRPPESLHHQEKKNDLKNTLENNPTLIILGVLITGFLSGIGAMSFLEARETKLREQIISQLKAQNNSLQAQSSVVQEENIEFKSRIGSLENALRNVIVPENDASWAGEWSTETPQGEYDMILSQNGSSVEGTYKGRNRSGDRVSGTIVGDVKGNVLIGNWQRNESETGNWFCFTITETGNSFSGPYGNEIWSGTKK